MEIGCGKSIFRRLLTLLRAVPLLLCELLFIVLLLCVLMLCRLVSTIQRGTVAAARSLWSYRNSTWFASKRAVTSMATGGGEPAELLTKISKNCVQNVRTKEVGELRISND